MRAEAQLRAPGRRDQPRTPTLAAYNDHLADIATRPKKRLWGH